VGYSPERINPGDRVHTFASITKVVSGQDSDTLAKVAAVYESVIAAGVHRSPSIKVAEAAKVIENTQRDLNIALMNELALIFERFGLDTGDVLAAAGSKWNFLRFRPGLVGGHCIGVDPHYLTHRAIVAGYHPQVILAGRRINDEMGKFIASRVVKCLIRKGYNIKESTVTVLGLTFKEDVPDLRNTRVIDIVRELQDYGMRVQVQDPLVDRDEAQTEYGIEVANELDVLAPAQAVVLAVSHRLYVEQAWDLVAGLLRDQSGVVVDVKGVLEREAVPGGISLWRL
jgi:UDP-N-acetyl-D-galactosamine dehydrogenase